MTPAEWVAAVTADAPPLSPRQRAVLQSVFSQHVNAAPACPQEPRSEITEPERNTA